MYNIMNNSITGMSANQGKIDIISCTGANLEEDIMNLVAHSHYKRVPNYRDLSPQDEWDLLENHYNRVTDTCIPEEEAFRRLQKHIHQLWKEADDQGERYFPHEFMYKMLLSGVLEQYYEIDPKTVSYTHLDVYKRQPSRPLVMVSPAFPVPNEFFHPQL